MEKTFEELIEPLKIGGFDGWYDIEFISTGKVLELLKQVREATIKECRECLTIEGYDDVPISFFEQKYKFNQLPTDRIKIEP